MYFRFHALSHGALASIGAIAFIGGPLISAQTSGNGFELHGNGNVTANDVGLSPYPGAKLVRKDDSNSAVDMGFTFGDTHFRLVAAEYQSGDSAERIFDFYRKNLSRYGDVLECDHGKAVGPVKTARSGLTCSEGQKDGVQAEGSVDSSSDHELRAGSPEKYRIVGIGKLEGAAIRFGMVLVEMPKESRSRTKAD